MNFSERLAAIVFFLAVAHTLAAPAIHAVALRARIGSARREILGLLGEVELAFALWSVVLFALWASVDGISAPADYFRTRSFSEPIFVFVILAIAASLPVDVIARRTIEAFATALGRATRLPRAAAELFGALTIGTLAGSVISEPAAMAVCAIFLGERFFRKGAPGGAVSERMRFAVLATLLVNVSIGGTLTHFAAPPVLMVASAWGWGTPFMLAHFGWRAIGLTVTTSALLLFRFRAELAARAAGATAIPIPHADSEAPPLVVSVGQILFLAVTVFAAHSPLALLGIFVAYVAFHAFTRRHQRPIQFREALLVALFLGGLVFIGGRQSAWIAPVLSAFDPKALFLAATALTAVTDNAALTYLGSLIDGTSDAFRYALVAGAVTGGGLTVIANAPNAIGFTILQRSFEGGRIRAWRLFRAALVPTLLAMAWFGIGI